MAKEKELTLEEALAKITEQQSSIEALTVQNTDLSAELATSTELTSDLQEQLANAQAGQEISQAVVVTHEREQYKVLAPNFQHKGTAYKAAELSKNPGLVKELVEGKVGILHKLEKAKK